ncbi:MAG TPA: nitroreductase family protein [Candidatus Cloacimonadota bacterium]|jgi:nitroreductase|nr:nitroreductase family protein [Candidatus Cloacimonadota bacterium]
MEILEYIHDRYSVRSYKSDPISEEILDIILEAGRLAPSAQNSQCWQFVVITDQDLIKKIAFHSLIGSVNFFIKDAPVVIVACADPKKSIVLNEQPLYLIDTALSFQQMMMAAWHYGIGSCWLGAFNEKALKDLLDIPTHIKIVGLSPFGYPKEKKNLYAKAVSFFASSKKRLAKEKIIHYNNWNNKVNTQDKEGE